VGGEEGIEGGVGDFCAEAGVGGGGGPFVRCATLRAGERRQRHVRVRGVGPRGGAGEVKRSEALPAGPDGAVVVERVETHEAQLHPSAPAAAGGGGCVGGHFVAVGAVAG
jgi:hypothetical protein